MLKCCICGGELTSARWACARCCREYNLGLTVNRWPEWARSEQRREQARRRFKPSYGVSTRELNEKPYVRRHENALYRKANNIASRKSSSSPATRVHADNLLYSSRGDESPAESGRNYAAVFGAMPHALQQRLTHHIESHTIVHDAIRALPLISQRAIDGLLRGRSLTYLAEAEGVSEATMRWLASEAKQRLADILTEKLGADDGMRYGK